MSSILKDLPKLIESGVITEETAARIRAYYHTQSDTSTSRLFIVFGILGAILVGLGIILILAHNWDEFSRFTKTVFAFLPLILGQLLCGYVILKKADSVAWRESATAFLFFSIGASIALVSQIYNMPGSLPSFILTWMLLALPLTYLMKSSINSLLYIGGITYYAWVSYGSYPSATPHLYGLLLLLALPHYYFLYKEKRHSNFMTFHNWLIPLSLITTLGTFTQEEGALMFLAYFSLFGLLYLIGENHFFATQKNINNGYKMLGSLGTVIMLLMFSFSWYWEDVRSIEWEWGVLIATYEFWLLVIISILALLLFYSYQKDKSLQDISPISPLFILLILTFFMGLYTSTVAVVWVNICIFLLGILTIRRGAQQNHLGTLNYGLLIITALVICRFFDTNISFVIRGLLFLAVGVGFFIANYWMLKKRNTHEG